MLPIELEARLLLDIAFGMTSLVTYFSFWFGGFSPDPLFLVLGIPHPAVATRDVRYMFPSAMLLSSPNQIIGLQTLMWHLMSRRIQDEQQHPVSASRVET